MSRRRTIGIGVFIGATVAGMSLAVTGNARAAANNTYTGYSVGINGGEPSIGFNPLPLHNVALYGSGTNVKRLAWNDTAFPATMTVADAKPQTAVTTLDAITIIDQVTGRSFNSQLAAVCSLASFSDTDGASWTPSQGCGENTLLDHQSLGGGPFHASAVPLPPPGSTYPDSVYYCAQNGFNATCAISVNGGQTFQQGVDAYNTPANDPSDPNATFAAEGGACSALHGHIRVGPDGTAYLPLKGCGGTVSAENATNTEFVDGRPSLSISADNGTTWLVNMVPASNVDNGSGGTNAVENPDESDPSVGISKPSGVLYYGWENGHNPSDFVNGTETQAMVAVSHDNGAHWSAPTDVSSPLGLHNVQFPEVIAGDDNRAAFAFLGTAAIGDDQTNAFPKDPPWHLYVSTTYDGGLTWSTVDTTPTDFVQRGCIDLQGTTVSQRTNVCSQRNLLDFNDITVDKEGRPLVAYSDGCNTACAANPASGSTGAVDMVMRQTCGLGLYSQFDATGLNAGCLSAVVPEARTVGVLLVAGGFAAMLASVTRRRRRSRPRAA